MKNLTDMHLECNDDNNKKRLVELWGNSLNQLTPKQRQLLVEIFSNLKLTGTQTANFGSYAQRGNSLRSSLP